MKKYLLIIIFAFITFSFSSLQLTGQNNPVTGTSIGNVLPEISLSNPQGETIKLSELRGNIVLVDFWASWCRPCRHENPVVRYAYTKFSKEKFKDATGFKILSVSLDNNKNSWTDAIAADSLYWDEHVSDLQGWRSTAARQMGVRSIPASFLLDKNGVIIATNLRGDQLERTLQNLIEK